MKRLNLPAIPSDANKYSRGSLLVLGGSARFPGAAILAARAGELTGAGYVTLATPASVVQVAQKHLLSIPVVEARQKGKAFAADALSDIIEQVNHIDAVVLGPGLTSVISAMEFAVAVQLWAQETNTPLLMDADALRATISAEPIDARVDEMDADALRVTISAEPTDASVNEMDADVLKATTSTGPINTSPDDKHQPVLTPHAGELLRLFRKTETFSAQALAQKCNAIVVAKGPITTITDGVRVATCSEGTPALAKAGTGDVLSGIIGALLAQGMGPFEAAEAGVTIHARAGCLAEKRYGTRSVIPEHLLEALPAVLRDDLE